MKTLGLILAMLGAVLLIAWLMARRTNLAEREAAVRRPRAGTDDAFEDAGYFQGTPSTAPEASHAATSSIGGVAGEGEHPLMVNARRWFAERDLPAVPARTPDFPAAQTPSHDARVNEPRCASSQADNEAAERGGEIIHDTACS